MKIGPSHSAKGLTEGIHWHINKDVKIEYMTSEEDRSAIPWVRYINAATNDTIIYENIDSPLSEEDIAENNLNFIFIIIVMLIIILTINKIPKNYY